MAIYARNEQGQFVPLPYPTLKGEKGKDGVTPNFTIGNVTTLPSGQQATVVIRGDKKNPIIDFGIPKGQDGTGAGNQQQIENMINELLKGVRFDEATFNLIFTKYNNQELRIDLSQLKSQLNDKAQSLSMSQDGNSLQLMGGNNNVLSNIPLMTQEQVNEIKNLFQ